MSLVDSSCYSCGLGTWRTWYLCKGCKSLFDKDQQRRAEIRRVHLLKDFLTPGRRSWAMAESVATLPSMTPTVYRRVNRSGTLMDGLRQRMLGGHSEGPPGETVTIEWGEPGEVELAEEEWPASWAANDARFATFHHHMCYDAWSHVPIQTSRARPAFGKLTDLAAAKVLFGIVMEAEPAWIRPSVREVKSDNGGGFAAVNQTAVLDDGIVTLYLPSRVTGLLPILLPYWNGLFKTVGPLPKEVFELMIQMLRRLEPRTKLECDELLDRYRVLGITRTATMPPMKPPCSLIHLSLFIARLTGTPSKISW